MMFTHVTGSFGMLSSRLHALLGQIIVLLLKASDAESRGNHEMEARDAKNVACRQNDPSA